MTDTALASPSGSRLAPADPRLGSQLGDFRLVRLLGRGGMGAVYEARDTALDRQVAVKLMATEAIAADPGRQERFLREARAAAKLDHPNVVTILQVGEQAGELFIAMQLVRGRSAAEALRDGALPVVEALRIVRDAARALAAAHALGLIHRDIKPGNILVGSDGVVKVADFGLAKPAADGAGGVAAASGVVGTPHFMSPEQAQGFPVDARSDLYALGATFWCLLTGRPPFDGDSPPAVLLKHVMQPLPRLADARPDAPAEFAPVLGRMMAKDPRERYQSADELLVDLDRLAAGCGLPAVPVAGGTARSGILRPAGTCDPGSVPAPAVPTSRSGTSVRVVLVNPSAPGGLTRGRVWAGGALAVAMVAGVAWLIWPGADRDPVPPVAPTPPTPAVTAGDPPEPEWEPPPSEPPRKDEHPATKEPPPAKVLGRAEYERSLARLDAFARELPRMKAGPANKRFNELIQTDAILFPIFRELRRENLIKETSTTHEKLALVRAEVRRRGSLPEGK